MQSFAAVATKVRSADRADIDLA